MQSEITQTQTPLAQRHTVEDSQNLMGKRIVVIAGDPHELLGLRQRCQQAGMRVVGTALDGKEGVAIVLLEHPDIVLADIELPILDGIEVARRILEQKEMCVILLAENADTEKLGEIADLGVHGHLVKPVPGEVLLPAIEEAYFCFQQGTTFGFCVTE